MGNSTLPKHLNGSLFATINDVKSDSIMGGFRGNCLYNSVLIRHRLAPVSTKQLCACPLQFTLIYALSFNLISVISPLTFVKPPLALQCSKLLCWLRDPSRVSRETFRSVWQYSEISLASSCGLGGWLLARFNSTDLLSFPNDWPHHAAVGWAVTSFDWHAVVLAVGGALALPVACASELWHNLGVSIWPSGFDSTGHVLVFYTRLVCARLHYNSGTW